MLTWRFKSVGRSLGRLLVGVELLNPDGSVHSLEGYYPTADMTIEQLTQAIDTDVQERVRGRAFDELQAQIEARIAAGG